MFNNETTTMIDIFNNNQGVVAVIGLFIVIPLSILSDKIISKCKTNDQRTELKRILLKELWININFIGQNSLLINDRAAPEKKGKIK